MEKHEQTTDFRQITDALRRRWLLIAAFVLLAAGAAYGVSKLQTEKYEATAKLLFRTANLAPEAFGTDSSSSTANIDPARQAETNVDLVDLPIVATRTSQQLGGTPPARQISDSIGVSTKGLSDVVSVTATDPNPERARLLANTFARQFVAFRAETDQSKLRQAGLLAERQYQRLSAAEKTGPRGEALARAAERLGISASLQTGNAELVQSAEVPSGPSSPKPLRNSLLGGVLGLMLGVGFAFLFERLNRGIRDPGEAGEAFDLPVLGTIPYSKAISKTNEASGAVPLPFAESESFRSLRAALRYFDVGREIGSVVVTSGAVGEGKSTVSWNLALAAASSTSKVVLVEADMRDPSLARQHGLQAAPGLSELLTEQDARPEATQFVSAAIDGDVPTAGARVFDVIVAGAIPPNPAELVESPEMGELLETLGGRYDLVVIDTVPIGVVSDAFPLFKKVDGVIVVMRAGKTTRDSAERTREQLKRLDAQVLGIVPNCVKASRRADSNGYYGRRREQVPVDPFQVARSELLRTHETRITR